MVNPAALRKKRDELDDESDALSFSDSVPKNPMQETKAPPKKPPETKKEKMKASVREWGETSSCHGIPHMAGASTLFAAAIWCVILVICAIIFVYLFSDTLRQYLRFDKIVKLNLGLESTNFPSVTFCNINPYKISKIQNVPELQALLDVYESTGSS